MLFLALLAPLLQLTAAAPATDVAVVGRTHLLGKRGDGTGVHLVNCDAFGGEGTIRPPSSYVVVRLQPRSSSSFCGFPNNHIAFNSSARSMATATMCPPQTTAAPCQATSSSPGREQLRLAHSLPVLVLLGSSTPTHSRKLTSSMLGKSCEAI